MRVVIRFNKHYYFAKFATNARGISIENVVNWIVFARYQMVGFRSHAREKVCKRNSRIYI